MTWQEKLKIITQKYDVIEIIHGKSVKAIVQCKKCRKERTTRIDHLFKEDECKFCKQERMLLERQERFVSNMSKINPNIEVLSPYTGNDKKVKCRCKIDGHEWHPIASNLLQGHGCPKCQSVATSTRCRKDNEVFKNELYEKFPQFEILGTYTTSNDPIMMKCHICGHVWSPRPYNLLSGYGCPECARLNQKCTHQQYVDKIEQKWQHLYVISQYIDSGTPIRVGCKTCGHEWSTDPSYLLFYGSCPMCAKKIKHSASLPNRVMYSVLDFFKISYIPEFKYVNTTKRYDVYIPSINTIIEMHGKQHYEDIPYWNSNVKSVQQNDVIKKDIAISHGITNYIVINASVSRFLWILKNIALSDLLKLLQIPDNKILEERDKIANILKNF